MKPAEKAEKKLAGENLGVISARKMRRIILGGELKLKQVLFLLLSW